MGTAANVNVMVTERVDAPARYHAAVAAEQPPGRVRHRTSVTIAWNAATDNVGVAGYGVYRGSSQTGQTQQATASYSGLTCGTAYQVGVDAYDAAGNRSPRADLP